MLLKVAWRNIWRSISRSLVVIGSIALGIWDIIFGTGFTNGFLVGYSANMIEHDISNIQVHHPDFKTDFDIHYFIILNSLSLAIIIIAIAIISATK